MWRCRNRMDNGADACDLKSIDNKSIENAVVQAVNHMLREKRSVIDTVKENILKAVGNVGNHLTATIDSRIKDLEQKVVELVKGGKSYDSLLEELDSLKKEKARLLEADVECKKESEMLSGIMAFLDNQADVIVEYDDKLTRRLVKEIEVHEDTALVTFKHGQLVEVNI